MPKQVHDHRGRQRIGEVGDIVDGLAAQHLGFHAVDQVADDILDVGPQVLDAGGREGLVEQAPQPRVVGRVAEHHPVVEVAHQGVDRAALILLIGLEEGRESIGRDLPVVQRHLLHV
ncbi:MAG: hypothetical protein NTV97_13820 [Alphaproteobacteria bacterium]|nr:hypothetical protein [Alphaproteobacteria bacterium]